MILGGGYVAAEFAHVFSSFGARTSLVLRGDTLTRHLDADIARAFTDHRRAALGPAPGAPAEHACTWRATPSA